MPYLQNRNLQGPTWGWSANSQRTSVSYPCNSGPPLLIPDLHLLLQNSTSSPSSSSCCLLRAYLWLQHYLQQQPPVRLWFTPGPIPSCCLLRAYPTSGSNTTSDT